MSELVVAGRKVCFADVGSGEPVLLLHAASSSSAQWRSLSEALLARGGLRVLAPDLQGYGGSTSWDPRQPLRLEDEFGPLRAVIDHAGGGPLHLIGHSYGAMLALRLALADPALRLRSLTLIEPVAFWLLRGAGEQGLYTEIRTIAEAAMQAFDAGDIVGTVAPYIDYWSGQGAWEALPEPVRNYVLATAGKARWAVALGDTDAGASLTDCERLQVPTLLIRGERARAPTRRIVDLLQDAIPGASIADIPNASHMAPITHPEPVNAAIAAHLSRVSSSPAGDV
ncbi:MAG TPA: alpha/beta hydrolase [Roseomonas sp.]|jgi:pimeloyl-ACP methyl ester carboxylesterase